MVSDAVLWKVVCPDFIGPVPGTENRLSELLLGFVPLVILQLLQSFLKYLKCLSFVLDLGALVLVGNEDTCGEMRDPYRAVGCVDVLAPGALGAVRVHAQIFLLNNNIIKNPNRCHDNGRRARMNPPIFLALRDSYDFMRPGLKLQCSVHMRPLYQHGRALVPLVLRILANLSFLNRPVALMRERPIHLIEVLRE
jgi:hypothetical protein